MKEARYVSADQYLFGPGRADYKYATAMSRYLKIGPEFWRDLRSLLYVNRGINILAKLVTKEALKRHELSPEMFKKPNEMHIYFTLDHLFHRTVRFNKCCELISYKDIEEGRPEQLLFMPQISKSSVRVAFKILEESELVFRTSLPETYSGSLIFINLELIIKRLHDAFLNFFLSEANDREVRLEAFYGAWQATTMTHFWVRFFEGNFKELICGINENNPAQWKDHYKAEVASKVKMPCEASDADPYRSLYDNLYPSEGKLFLFFKPCLVIFESGDIATPYDYSTACLMDALPDHVKTTLRRHFWVEDESPALTEAEIEAPYDLPEVRSYQ